MGANAHRAFFNSSEKDSYLDALTVDAGQRCQLQAARDKIREALTDGLREWSAHIDRDLLFEARAIAAFQFGARETALRPKFRMQGSFSYHTLNRTTQNPPQEVDLDDGVFLPVSFITQNGHNDPVVASDGYFTVVQKVLAPLCRREGWHLVTDKPACVRVRIDEDSHIDLALYAIPDGEFEELLAKAAMSFGARDRDETVAFAEDVYPRLPTDRIMLAHREQGWKPSDPRKLEEWFEDAIREHGQQLRRVCRYVKGWRDHSWKACRLSSIALMACIVAAYDDALAAIAETRDDLALQMVAGRLPHALAGRIRNPVVDGQYLDEGWTPEIREDFIAEARALAASIDRALASNRAATVVEQLRGALGSYFPKDAELIVVDTVPSAPAILTSGLLREIVDEAKEREAVKKGGDGRYG